MRGIQGKRFLRLPSRKGLQKLVGIDKRTCVENDFIDEHSNDGTIHHSPTPWDFFVCDHDSYGYSFGWTMLVYFPKFN